MKEFTIEFTNDGVTVRTARILCYEYELKKYMYDIMEGILKQMKCRGKILVNDFYSMEYNGITIGLETNKGGGWIKTFIEY